MKGCELKNPFPKNTISHVEYEDGYNNFLVSENEKVVNYYECLECLNHFAKKQKLLAPYAKSCPKCKKKNLSLVHTPVVEKKKHFGRKDD